jgi:hypothetical protein
VGQFGDSGGLIPLNLLETGILPAEGVPQGGGFTLRIAAALLQFFTGGALKPAVRLTFDKVADRDGIANIYWQNDYFGCIYVNGKLAHHGLNGPEPGTKKWGVRPVVLKKGKNEIVFETRHGMSGGWKLALSVEGP